MGDAPFGTTPVMKPLVVADPNATTWDRETDLLVIGCGAAGASAALEGAEQGLDVIIADRFQGGGASALSGGIVYTGGGSKYQHQAGYSDSVDAMYDYLRHEVEDAVSPATLRRFCEDSLAQLAWLESHGVEFDGTPSPHKTSYPQRPHFLYYSGNEAVAAYAGKEPPAPRGHRVKGGPFSGLQLMNGLKASLRRMKSVTFLTQAAARRLIVTSAGEVVGAEIWQVPEGSAAALHRLFENLGKQMFLQATGIGRPLLRRLARIEARRARPMRVRARKGVVLAAGGFIKNRALVHRLAPKYEGGFPLGSAGCDGSGLRLGLSVGAATARLGTISAWRFIDPPLGWVKGIVVDKTGKRLTNEEQYGARIGDAIMERAQGGAWLIIDRAVHDEAQAELRNEEIWAFQKFPAKLMMRFAAAKAKSIEGLAAALDMPVGAFVETVAAYNDAARGRGPDTLGKSQAMMAPLTTPPFYAIDVSQRNRFFPLAVLSLGGLAVDEETGAVRGGNGPIPGLYAAGRSACGIPSNFYVSGLSLADCVWSGRRAARSIAKASQDEARAGRKLASA